MLRNLTSLLVLGLAGLAHATPSLLQSKLSVMIPQTCWHNKNSIMRKQCEAKNTICCLQNGAVKATCLLECSGGTVVDPQTGKAPKTPQEDVQDMIEKNTGPRCADKLKVEPAKASYEWDKEGNFYVRDMLHDPENGKIVVHLEKEGAKKKGYCHIGLVAVRDCSQSGTALLAYISHAMVKLGCRGIELEDDAHVTYGGGEGRMRIIYGLTHEGQSWYESKGFKPLAEGYNKARDFVMDMSLQIVRELIEGSPKLSKFQDNFGLFAASCDDGLTFWACMQDAAATDSDRKEALYKFTDRFFNNNDWATLKATGNQEEFVNAMNIYGKGWPKFDKPL